MFTAAGIHTLERASVKPEAAEFNMLPASTYAPAPRSDPSEQAVNQKPVIRDGITRPTMEDEYASIRSGDAAPESDAESLARRLYAECRGESREGKLMVAQCILDRVADGTWGSKLETVLSSPNQFAPPGKLTDDLLAVAEAALAGERFSDQYMILYFRETASTGDWYAPYLGHVGGHAYYGYVKQIGR